MTNEELKKNIQMITNLTNESTEKNELVKSF